MMPTPARPIPADAVTAGRQASTLGVTKVPVIMPANQAELSEANPMLPAPSTARAKNTSATAIIDTATLATPAAAMSRTSSRSRRR